MANCLYCDSEFNGDKSGIIICGDNEVTFIYKGEFVKDHLNKEKDSVIFCTFSCLSTWILSSDDNRWLRENDMGGEKQTLEEEISALKMQVSSVLRTSLSAQNEKSPYKFIYYHPRYEGVIYKRDFDAFGIPIIFTDRVPKGKMILTDGKAFVSSSI